MTPNQDWRLAEYGRHIDSLRRSWFASLPDGLGSTRDVLLAGWIQSRQNRQVELREQPGADDSSALESQRVTGDDRGECEGRSQSPMQMPDFNGG